MNSNQPDVIAVGLFEVNCLVVLGTENRAVVIDPGADAEQIELSLQRHHADVDAYLLTHGHADHLCALAALHAVRPAPVYLHEADQAWAFGTANQIPPYYPVPQKPETPILHPGPDPIRAAGLVIECIETPGHTPGSVCYSIPERRFLFSGDTLFKGTCGRTDLPGGNARILSESLKKLAKLPSDMVVYPGHGESTDIGYEQRTNPFMR